MDCESSNDASELSPPTMATSFHRFLLSSPARFLGEFESEDLSIKHAWPQMMHPRPQTELMIPGPTHRSFFVVSVKFEEESVATDPLTGRTPARRLENYFWYGDFLASVLGVFYGKRFDNHGFIETHGMFSVPAYDSIPGAYLHELPFNDSKPRVDLSIELNLCLLENLSSLLVMKSDESRTDAFFTAGGFYLRAIRSFREHPEMAYVDLVACGELLAYSDRHNSRDMLDDEIRGVLDEIELHLEHGKKKAKLLESRMRQIKKGFEKTVFGLLGAEFFATTQAKVACMGLNPYNIKSAIRSAYDLRSKYVHTGARFGDYVSFLASHLAEVQSGRSANPDKAFAKLLDTSPTFIGLERIMRYALISYLHRHLCCFDERLDWY